MLNCSNTQGLNKLKLLLCIPSLCYIAACKIKTSIAGASLKKKNLHLCLLHCKGSQRRVEDVLPWIAEQFWDDVKWSSSSLFNHTKKGSCVAHQIFADMLLPRPCLHCLGRRTRKGNQLRHTPQVNPTRCKQPAELHCLEAREPLLSTMPREWRLLQSCRWKRYHCASLQ